MKLGTCLKQNCHLAHYVRVVDQRTGLEYNYTIDDILNLDQGHFDLNTEVQAYGHSLNTLFVFIN